MAKFSINYYDSATEQRETVEEEFHDTPSGYLHGTISALEWAEDRAYMLGDKRCDWVIKEILP